MRRVALAVPVNTPVVVDTPVDSWVEAAMAPSAAERIAPRHRIALHSVASDQASAIVISPGPGGLPAWLGTGGWDYVCGSCTTLLCAGVGSERTFPSLVFRCTCGALNRSS